MYILCYYLTQCNDNIIEPAHEIMVLSHRRPAKAQVSLRIRAVLPEPSLFAHISMEVD